MSFITHIQHINVNTIEETEINTYTDYTRNQYAVSRFHRHPGHELVLCHTPSAIVFSGEEIIRASGWMAIFYPAGELHLQLNQPNAPYERYYIEYPVDFLTDGFPLYLNPHQFFVLPLSDEEMETCRLYLNLLTNTLREPDSTWKENRQKYLLALLHNELCACSKNTAQSSKKNSSEKEQRIYAVCVYIQRHYREKLSLDSLAEIHFMSRATLTRQFRNVLGMSVSEYIRRVRISYAVQELKQGKSVQETADLCGFSDAGYFIKVFEQIHGMTPTDYRKRIRTKK